MRGPPLSVAPSRVDAASAPGAGDEVVPFTASETERRQSTEDMIKALYGPSATLGTPAEAESVEPARPHTFRRRSSHSEPQPAQPQAPQQAQPQPAQQRGSKADSDVAAVSPVSLGQRLKLFVRRMIGGAGASDAYVVSHGGTIDVGQLVIDPSSSFKNAWDWMIIFFVVYNSIFIPLTLAFHPPFADSPAYKGFDAFVDVSFALDILITFQTGLTSRWGTVITDRALITRTYVRGWFLVDLIATFPFEVASSDLTWTGILKIPRLLRLGRLMKKVEQLSSASAFRILKLLFGFVLLAHLVACFWYFLSDMLWECAHGECDEPIFEADEIWLSFIDPNASLAHRYTVSLYFSMTTMSTVGYGDMYPLNDYERTFAIVVMLLSSVASACIFGNVAVQIQEFDKTHIRYQQKVAAVNEFFRIQQLPSRLHTKTLGYIDSLWAINRGIDPETILMELPVVLRAEIMMTVHAKLIDNVPFFRNCSHAFLRLVVMMLRPQVCRPGDYVVVEGEKAAEMFFVHRGACEVQKKITSVDGLVSQVRITLSAGTFFGESALLSNTQNNKRRNASVRAIVLTHLYRLSCEDFEEAIYHFPEYRNTLAEMAERRSAVTAFKQQMSDTVDANIVSADFHLAANILQSWVRYLRYVKNVSGNESAMVLFKVSVAYKLALSSNVKRLRALRLANTSSKTKDGAVQSEEAFELRMKELETHQRRAFAALQDVADKLGNLEKALQPGGGAVVFTRDSSLPVV